MVRSGGRFFVMHWREEGDDSPVGIAHISDDDFQPSTEFLSDSGKRDGISAGNRDCREKGKADFSGSTHCALASTAHSLSVYL